MTFIALHKRVTYAFALLGFAALALGADLGLPAIVTGASLALGSWFAEGPRIHTKSYARTMTGVVFGVLFVQIARGLLGADILQLGLQYAGFLQLTRLAHRRTATEHLHIVAIAMLHLLAGTLLSTGLDYAVVFLGFVIVTPWMLSLTHLRGEIERQHTSAAELEGPPSPRLLRVLQSKNLATSGFLAASSLLSLPLFAITATFFLVFPRVGLGVLTFGDASGPTTAGFGNTVDLGHFGTIRDDPTVVARVFGSHPASGEPLEAAIRLRGTSFSDYDGVAWTRPPSPGVRREGTYLPVELFARHVRRPSEVGVRIVLEPLDEPVLFLPPGTTALRVTSRVESGVDVARAIVIRPGVDVRLAEPDGVGPEYTALTSPKLTTIPEVIDDAMRVQLLRVPRGLERVARLSASIVPQGASPAEAASRIEAYLRDSGRLRYSLTTTSPGRTNPLVHFLFTSHTGHCEFFATAMAVMLRSQGIPARNVTGFLGGRWNPYGGYYAIRQGDAHSWVEAYIDGEFHTFDPTPSARASEGPVASALTPISEWLDAMRVRWASDVISYDMRRQIQLVLSIRDAFRSGSHGGTRRFETYEDPAAAAGRRGRSNFGVVGIAIAIAVLATVAFLVRRLPRRDRRGAAEVLMGDLDVRLARAGFPRAPGTTPRERLDALRALGVPWLGIVEEITREHESARYRDGQMSFEKAQALRAKLRAAVPSK